MGAIVSRLRHGLLGAFLTCLIGLPSHGEAARDSQAAARAFVIGLSSEIVLLLTSETSVTARENRLSLLLRHALDLEVIARTVIGNHWKEATPGQREIYRTLFADFVTRTYARQLAKHEVTSFSILSVDAAANGDAVVAEHIERPDGPPLSLGFRVRTGPKESKIVDISAEGVSMVLTQRSDFAAFVRREGFDALVEALREKLSKMDHAEESANRHTGGGNLQATSATGMMARKRRATLRDRT